MDPFFGLAFTNALFFGMADAETEATRTRQRTRQLMLLTTRWILHGTHTHTQKQSKHIQTYKPIQYFKWPCLFLGCLKSLYSKVCTQKCVLNSLYSTVCTQTFVLNRVYVLKSVCSKVCTQQLVLTSLYSTACTQKYVLTTLYSRAPHPTTTSTSLAKFSNRSKPCCQPVKAMLLNWSTGQSHVAKLINRSKRFSTVSERVSETLHFFCIMFSRLSADTASKQTLNCWRQSPVTRQQQLCKTIKQVQLLQSLILRLGLCVCLLRPHLGNQCCAVQETKSRGEENTIIPHRRICYSTVHKIGWHHMLMTVLHESRLESALYIVCTELSFAPSNLVWEDAHPRRTIMLTPLTEFPSHQHTVHCPVPNNRSTSDQSVIVPSTGSPVEDHGISVHCIL